MLLIFIVLQAGSFSIHLPVSFCFCTVETSELFSIQGLVLASIFLHHRTPLSSPPLPNEAADSITATLSCFIGHCFSTNVYSVLSETGSKEVVKRWTFVQEPFPGEWLFLFLKVPWECLLSIHKGTSSLERIVFNSTFEVECFWLDKY